MKNKALYKSVLEIKKAIAIKKIKAKGKKRKLKSKRLVSSGAAVNAAIGKPYKTKWR